MTAKLRILLLSVYFSGSSIAHLLAGEILISGTYQGKNLYVENSFSSSLMEFCTLEVYVNNVKSNINLNASAYEVDLSFLQLNDEVSIRIIHKDGCKPKVLNANVIKSSTNFHFESFDIDEKLLRWTTKGEKFQGKFFVEQLWHNSWVIVDAVDSKGGLGTNSYQAKENHHSKTNKYRIRFKERDGQFIYSQTEEYTSSKLPVTFTPKKTSNTIILSHNTHYEILDKEGNSLLKGSGMYISVASLKPGDYFLNVDNRSEKFTKH